MTKNPDGNGFASKLQVMFGGLALALGMLGGFWFAVYNPLSERIERLEAMVAARVAKPEYEEFRTRTNEHVARIDGIIIRLRDRVDRELLRMQESIVSRGEHVQQWQVRDNAITDVRAQLKDVKDDLKSIHPTTKVFDDILKRMERVESWARQDKNGTRP